MVVSNHSNYNPQHLGGTSRPVHTSSDVNNRRVISSTFNNLAPQAHHNHPSGHADVYRSHGYKFVDDHKILHSSLRDKQIPYSNYADYTNSHGQSARGSNFSPSGLFQPTHVNVSARPHTHYTTPTKIPENHNLSSKVLLSTGLSNTEHSLNMQFTDYSTPNISNFTSPGRGNVNYSNERVINKGASNSRVNFIQSTPEKAREHVVEKQIATTHHQPNKSVSFGHKPVIKKVEPIIRSSIERAIDLNSSNERVINKEASDSRIHFKHSTPENPHEHVVEKHTETAHHQTVKPILVNRPPVKSVITDHRPVINNVEPINRGSIDRASETNFIVKSVSNSTPNLKKESTSAHN